GSCSRSSRDTLRSRITRGKIILSRMCSSACLPDSRASSKLQRSHRTGGPSMNDRERTTPIVKLSLAEKFAAIHDQWNPRVVGELNGQQVKLVKLRGAFVWHHHEHEDELFLVHR